MIDLTQIGINIGVIAGIMGITEVVKLQMKGWEPAGRVIILVPLVLALAAALFLTRPFGWQEYGENAIIYCGSATYLFKFGKTTIGGK